MLNILRKILKILLLLAILLNGLFLDQVSIHQLVKEVGAQERFQGLAIEIPTVSRYFQGQEGTTVIMVKKGGEPVSGAWVTADYYKPDNTIFLSDEIFTEIVPGTGIYYNNFNIPSNADLGVYKVNIRAISTTTPTTFSDNFDDGDAAGWIPTSGTWVVEGGVYKQKSKDLAWHRSITGTSTWENYTFSADVRLDAATSTEWMSSSTVAAGLGDVGEHAAPEVFQMGGTWYLISGESDGTFNGYYWTGTGWQSTSTIVSGLATDNDLQTKPTVFQMDTTWYLIHGDYWSGDFTGYSWTGSSWQSDTSIVNGLSSIGYGSAPEVFQKDSTWYLISGSKDGTFYGFSWTGTSWQTDNTIVSGLGDIGIASAPEVLQMNTTWYLIAGEYDGDFHGFYWTGSQWASSTDIVAGLSATNYGWGHTKPTVYQMDTTWYLIAGEYVGTFSGYNWGEKSGEWGNYAGIIFRYTDPASNYEFHLIEDGINDRVGLRKNGSLVAMSDPGSVSISANTWYTLKVEAEDDRIKGYVDDVLKIDYYDPVPVTQGKIGFTNYDTIASYDNANVTIGAATSTAYLSHDFKVESQAEYVSSLQQEWKVYLSDFGEMTTNATYTAKLYILNYQSEHTDPYATPTVNIWDASTTPQLVVSDGLMTKISTGIYQYSYFVATTSPFGVWETEASVEVEAGKVIKANDYWEVEGSPAEVVINAITDTTIPTITANVTISNEGNAGYEYKYEWCVVQSEWNACGGGDDVFYSSAAKYIAAQTSWTTDLDATVPNPGFYWFKVVVYWGTEQSGASMTFTAIAFAPKSQNWQWFDDENNETPTESLAPENVVPTGVSTTNAILKLRLTIKETSGNTGEDVKMRLQFSTTSDFSTGVYFVEEIGNCTSASQWCYADGIDVDNATITTLVLTDSDTKATHNESGISTTTYDLLANAAAEWEFTIKSQGAVTSTTYYFRAYDNTSNTPVPLNTGESYPSIVPGVVALSFAISGVPEGTNTEGITTNFGTSPTSVPFGELPINTSKIGAQRLTVSTKAEYGYQVLVYGRQELISDSGDIINPISGTNEYPVSWQVATSSSYGYHAGDNTLSNIGDGPDRFAWNDTYARFETTMKEVAYNPNPVNNESTDLIFRAEVNVYQPLGDYSSEVVYIAVPTF